MNPSLHKRTAPPGEGDAVLGQSVEPATTRVADPAASDPIVEVLSQRLRQGNVFVLIKCPHCGRQHTHGAQAGILEHRVAHCGHGGYYFQLSAGAA